MRALVVGAGGFVGSHLAARLVASGWEVAGTVRPGSPGRRLAALGVDGEVDVVPVDLADGPTTAAAAAAARPDVAFLLGAARAAATTAQRAAMVAVNAASVAWVMEGLPGRCRAVVGLGSSTEYAVLPGPMDETTPVRPRGRFGATKAAGSLLLAAAGRRRGLRTAVLRAFQVYGPLDHPGRLVPSAVAAARRQAPLALTGPGRRRDWVFVDDVVEACVLAAGTEDLPTGQVLNLGTGRQHANEEVVAAVGVAAGRPVAVTPGHPGRPWDADSWVCDPALAGRLLGWRARVGLDEGVRRCWAAAGG